MAGTSPNANCPGEGGRTPNNRNRLTEDIRVKILNRLKAGERASSLAREFGVSRQAISLLKVKQANAKSRPRLIEEEIGKLRKLATSSRPSDHGWADPGSWQDEWSAKSLHKLGEKVANRRLMVLPIRRLFHEWFEGTGGVPIGFYDPDRPESLAGIPWELRDPEFLQFLRERKTSAPPKQPAPVPAKKKPILPSAKKRGRRGSAASLMPPPEAWEFLNSEALRASLGKAKIPEPKTDEMSPLARTGKHRGSKGSPFTAARKKKKKKKR
jgi:hypothetical protein